MAEDDKEDEDIYSDAGREQLTDDDEISPEEEGFMEGAEGLGQQAKCRACGKALISHEEVIERELEGDVVRFCSKKCVRDFLKRERD